MGARDRVGGKRDIIAKYDGYCIKCRGKIFKGAGASFDGSVLEHISCPPVAPIASTVYREPPIAPSRWKELCREIQESLSGMNCMKVVLEEDRKVYEVEGFVGMLNSIRSRTRCSGGEAVEIIRRWIDSLKGPIDEAKFQKVNQSCRREQPALVGEGSPTADPEECVDWDEEVA